MHKSVLLEESVKWLAPEKGKRIIDATLGAGGHTIEFLKKGAEVLGIDQDEDMLMVASRRLKDIEACPSFKLIQGNFRDIDRLARDNGYDLVDGVLMDLGISSLHYEMDRGFSFNEKHAPLDMRLDKSLGVSAADLINSLNSANLFKLFGDALDYKDAKRLVKKIIKKREDSHFKSVGDFLELFDKTHQNKLHPATRAFMALRIAVNMELDVLKIALPAALSVLKPGGVLAVISFHSGEDEIVKQSFKEFEIENKGKVETKKPVRPGNAEIEENPRARSAKLRVFRKK